MYTHVLDQWGIIYDQPIILNQRQAGMAIEGMVRQKASTELRQLAVDTHGFTDFAMATSKLLGFDLCPRLKKRSLENIIERGVIMASGRRIRLEGLLPSSQPEATELPAIRATAVLTEAEMQERVPSLHERRSNTS
jgi:hypothetical protein